MSRLMEKLNIEIPKWKVVRYCEVVYKDSQIIVNGRDEMHNYYSLFPKVMLSTSVDSKFKKTSEKEPHTFKLPSDKEGLLKITLHFQGHYKETPVSVDFDPFSATSQVYKLSFDPFTLAWESPVPLY